MDFEKKVVKEQIGSLKRSLDDSMLRLNAEKLEIEDKVKSYEKLKKKIAIKK